MAGTTGSRQAVGLDGAADNGGPGSGWGGKDAVLGMRQQESPEARTPPARLGARSSPARLRGAAPRSDGQSLTVAELPPHLLMSDVATPPYT